MWRKTIVGSGVLDHGTRVSPGPISPGRTNPSRATLGPMSSFCFLALWVLSLQSQSMWRVGALLLKRPLPGSNTATDRQIQSMVRGEPRTVPQPFGVKYWEIGNEIWGNWVRGHSDAETYARNYLRYAKAMRAIDPSIKLIAVGDNDMNWNQVVLRAAGKQIDYLAVHHYYGRREMAGDALNLMARPLFFERFYRQLEQTMRELVPGRKIKLAINEWGLDLSTQQQYSLESALYAARLMNVFERSGEIVEMSAVSDLVNGWPGGIIQANRHGVFVSPIYLVNRLYNEHRGNDRLAATVNGPTFDTSKEGRNVPYLDVVVNRADERIFIKAVNTHRTDAITTTINVQGAALGQRAEVKTVTAPSLRSFNDFSQPEAVSIKKTTLPIRRPFVLTLPKHSVTVITLNTP